MKRVLKSKAIHFLKAERDDGLFFSFFFFISSKIPTGDISLLTKYIRD